jgi:histidine kinase
MINISGYQINEQIFKCFSSTIFRATRIPDKIPVIIKLLNIEYPSEKELSFFRREYEIAAKLSGDGIIKVFSLEKVMNSLAIVMEDFGGISVTKALKSYKIGIIEKLSIAVQISDALSQIHRQNIIHKDINPSNIIWNAKTNKVKIIDFGIASELKKEVTKLNNVTVIEGTFNYISPEQTGRMNRSIDYRTDLYSLGATLYEIFTGSVPFERDDETEIIYCHIAKKPVSPNDIDHEIPNPVSDIIMKLLSKTVEDRYQTASGVKYDLEFCLNEIKTDGHIENFIIAQKDIIDKFRIPDKLYGRTEEIRYLTEVFDKVSKGNSSLLLVDGYPGVGKSTLINEIYKSIAEKKGFYISGKFDQLEKNIPYYAMIQAFRGLMRQILRKSEDNVKILKDHIIKAIPQNVQIMTDLIPELEQIIGKQPDAIELNPVEAQNRFHMIFRDFINIFGKKEHPLVVFLDDLQWSDVATIDLIKYLLMSSGINYILFIGAYRKNEIYAGHMLSNMIDELKYKSHEIHRLFLKPLEKKDVNLMVADTVKCEPDKTGSLADIVFHKAKGNPFFTIQLLNSLYNRGIFIFQSDKGRWEWDLIKVKEIQISDNIIDLLVQSLELLPKQTLSVLKFASCIGNYFDLDTLSIICERSETEVGRDLWHAIEGELLYPLDINYQLINFQNENQALPSVNMEFCFQHDRIQQAIYSLIPENETPAFHLKIGKALLEKYRKTQNSQYIFNLVNHLNLGKELILEKEERIELMGLNLTAGKMAKKSTAYATAAKYLETGKSLLSDIDWLSLPEKYFELSLEHAEAVFSSGELIQAEELCNQLFEIANNNIDKGLVFNLKTKVLEFQAKFTDAIDEIRKSLELFNIYLPAKPEEINSKIEEKMGNIRQWLNKTPIEELVNLPEMADKEKILIMQLLFQIIPPAIQINPPLYILAALMMFELSINHGTTPYSCKCFADCGVIMNTYLADYATGYKLGEASFSLINKYNAEYLKPSVYFVFTYISYWLVHYNESIVYYDMAYKIGLETGDIQHAAYSLAHKAHLYMYAGKNLTECRQITEQAIKFLKEAQAAMPLLLAQIVLYAIEKFQTLPSDNRNFEIQDNEMKINIENMKNLAFLGRFFQYNTFSDYIHGDFKSAEKWNMMAEQIIFAAQSDFPIADHYLYQSLLLIKKIRRSSEDEQSKIMDTLVKNLGRMKYWSDNCPSNFLHKFYFLSAEIAIIKGESIDNIMNLYEKSLESIGKNDFLQMKAVINESIGNFWLKKENNIIGNAYIKESYYFYKLWGAARKIALLEKTFPEIFILQEKINKKNKSSNGGSSNNQSMTSNSIDMASIIKSTLAISGEIMIDKLLRTLMYIIIENAGAQHGVLLLLNEKDNEFYIEAMKSTSSDKIEVMQSVPYKEYGYVCHEIIQYVIRTMENIVLNDACMDDNFKNNQYIQKHKTKSVLCMPVIYQNTLKGVVYLENNLSDKVFTQEMIQILKILSSQASISIDNAKLYKNLEEKVKERTVQLNDANEKLKELSLLDPLTSLHNRRYIYDFISEISVNFIENKIRILNNVNSREPIDNNKVLGIFIIDIDHFKEVNDTYGHVAGDIALVTLSKVLKKMIRGDDFIVRWGGEEFLIILNNTKPGYLKTFSKNIINAIKDTPINLFENKTIHKTCSLGCAMMPLDIDNPEFLTLEQTINLSDYALYQAKENGRNQAAFIKLKKINKIDDSIKLYLTNLSRSVELNPEIIDIEFIR